MIVVRVELHSAITGKKTEIGQMHIFNDGSGSLHRGSYGVRVMRRGTADKVQREATVPDHPRTSAPIWNLVRKALHAAGF